MNPRKLIPLVFLLLVLVVLAFLFGRKTPQTDLRQEAGLTRFLPEDFLVSDVDRLEIFLGSKEDEKVLLEKEASGWRVMSHFDAPGNSDKVSTLLDKFKNLEGEFRVAQKSVLGDFDLTEERAIHFTIYKKKDTQPLLYLLVGKSLPGGGFVRPKGEDTVYVVDEDFRKEIGLFTDDLSKGPDPLPWINRRIMEVKPEDVERLIITWPDRKTVFEKKEMADSASDTSPKASGSEQGAGRPEGFHWVVGDPPSPFPLRENSVDQILMALARLTALDVIDPHESEEKGLDEPPFRCRITLVQGEEKILLGSHPDPFQEGYMIVEGGDGTLFRVSRNMFEQVFRNGADLFELPTFSFEEISIQRISLTGPGQTLVLEKTAGGEFRADPSGSEEKHIGQEEARRIWDSLANISPTDFVDRHLELDRGLEAPSHQASLMTNNGKSHVIAFGNEARGLAGRYMQIDDDPHIFVIARADFERIFPHRSGL